jgi:hypothetical protein
MLFMQDALRVKKAMSKAQNAGGVNPVKALQRRAGPFLIAPHSHLHK